MNIALILQQKLFSGIQRFMLDAPAATSPSAVRSHAIPTSALHTASLRADDGIVPNAKPVNARVMPLRVLRVVETGQPRSCTGRLVISGRMADVCAELDRLVEREAALH